MTELTAAGVITDADVDTLNAARTILKTIATRAQQVGGETSPAYRALWYGEVKLAATMAEDAIFGVFNIAQAAQIVALTERQLFNKATDDAAV